MAGVVLVSYI